VHVVRACFLFGRIRSDLHLQVVRAVWFERLAFVAASQDAAALCMAQVVVLLLAPSSPVVCCVTDHAVLWVHSLDSESRS
jgi:hypothetical protein